MSYVLATLLTEGAIPQGAVLHRREGQYNFYPFPNDGPIWTMDPEVWRACAAEAGAAKAWFALDIDDWIDAVCHRPIGSALLAAVVDDDLFHALGHEQAMHLPSLEEWKNRIGVTNTRSLGFDVLDTMGLSALTNIGFLRAELTELPRGLATNEFGLLPDAGSAAMFTSFADSSAPEHAPFAATRIILVDD